MRNEFINGNCFDVLPDIEDKSVDLLFTSPPDISQTDCDLDVTKYKTFQHKFLQEFGRVTKDDGFVVICQQDRKINGTVLLNHAFYASTMESLGFVLKDYKIIVRNYPVDKKDMYYFNYQHCLIFSRKAKIKRGGDFIRNILVYDTDRIGGIQGTFNIFVWNEKFIELVIGHLTKEKSFVVDPFSGSGVVCYVAKNMNRDYLGIELNKEVYDKSFMFGRLA
jgi:site-specific DNA-methyltransferase (adenine-specific)